MTNDERAPAAVRIVCMHKAMMMVVIVTARRSMMRQARNNPVALIRVSCAASEYNWRYWR